MNDNKIINLIFFIIKKLNINNKINKIHKQIYTYISITQIYVNILSIKYSQVNINFDMIIHYYC